MQILDFRLADGEPWQNGDVLLGFFDCEVGGLRLFECLLVRAEHEALMSTDNYIAPIGAKGSGVARATVDAVDSSLSRPRYPRRT